MAVRVPRPPADWAYRYADLLLKPSEPPQLLGMKPIRSELAGFSCVRRHDCRPEALSPRWHADGNLQYFGATTAYVAVPELKRSLLIVVRSSRATAV